MKFSHMSPEDLAEDIAMFVMSTIYYHPYTFEFMKTLGNEKERELDKIMIETILSRLQGSED